MECKLVGLDCIEKLMEIPGVRVVRGDTCQFGMTSTIMGSEGETGPVLKPAGFLTSSWCIAEELTRRCPGDHRHAHLLGNRAKQAAVYPEGLCDAVCRGLVRQKEFDTKKLVSTYETGIDDTKKLLNSLNGRPLMKDHWQDPVHEEDGGHDLQGYRPQDGRKVLRHHLDELHVREGVSAAGDDVSGEALEAPFGRTSSTRRSQRGRG